MDDQQNHLTQVENQQVNNPAPKSVKKKVVLIVLTVAVFIACLGGMYYWQNSKNQQLQRQLSETKAELEKVQTEKVEVDELETAPEAEAPAASTNSELGYLVIPEYGVKVKLSDANKVTYTIMGTPGGTGNADNIQSYATINLKNSVQGKKCATIGLSITQSTAGGETKIGNSYYGFAGGEPEPCGNTKEDALRVKIYNELVGAKIVAK